MRYIIIIIVILLCASLYSSAATLLGNSESYSKCLNCHQDMMGSYNNHFIQNDDDCQLCHLIDYSIPGHSISTITENSICLACHVEQDVINTDKMHKDLICRDCHNPHGSVNQYMFNNNIVSLCSNDCHTTHELGYSHPVGDDYVDKRTGEELTCISTCHSLHHPKDTKLLQYSGNNVCSQCHMDHY